MCPWKPDIPELPAPKVSFEVAITSQVQEWSAAVAIQAAFRGWRTRKRLHKAVWDAHRSMFRKMWGAHCFARRLALMRRLAADMVLSRSQAMMRLNAEVVLQQAAQLEHQAMVP